MARRLTLWLIACVNHHPGVGWQRIEQWSYIPGTRSIFQAPLINVLGDRLCDFWVHTRLLGEEDRLLLSPVSLLQRNLEVGEKIGSQLLLRLGIVVLCTQSANRRQLERVT